MESSRVLGTAQVEAIPDYNWYPGYYVLSNSVTASGKQAILDDPMVEPFTGVQFRYYWADSELSPNDYSAGFAALDADLQRVAAKGKKIIVMLMYKKSDGTSSVPADLRTGPGPWCSGSYCGELTNGKGTSVALLWNSVVEARLNAWITAMARHLSESPYAANVAGILFNETSLGTTDTTVLASANYDPDVYIQALENNMLAATTAAPRLITILYFEGGFVSMNGSSVNAGQKIGDWMLLHPRTGAGTPDADPKQPKGTNHPCANSTYQSSIACAPAVQANDYSTQMTDSFDQTFNYETNPVPTGLHGSFLTFSYAVGAGPNAFTFADVSSNIPSHPIPNIARPWPVSAGSPSITTTTPADATNTQAYSQILAATGGMPPYTWSLASGSLPTGLSLDATTGAITGTPAAAPGDYTFTAEVTDSTSQTATKALSISVADPLSVTTSSLPGGIVGQAYSQTVSATGGKAPYSWSVTSGALPPGLTIDASTGTISGTPTSSGSFGLTVGVTDSGNPARTASNVLSVSIVAQLAITTTSLPGGTVGAAYSQTLTASGGSPSYTWSLAAGGLPPGLTLDSTTGVISGTPTTSGAYSFTAQVTDGTLTTSEDLSIVVSSEPPPPLTITTSSLPQGRVGAAYSASLAASGGSPLYTWSRTSGSLPPGLSLSSSGTISGTPTKRGSYTFAVQVLDSTGATASKTFTVKISRR